MPIQIDSITLGLLTIFIGLISAPIAYLVNYFIKRIEEKKIVSKEIALNNLNPLLIELIRIENRLKLFSYYPNYFIINSIDDNNLSTNLLKKIGEAFIYLQNNHLRKSLIQLTLVLEQLELLSKHRIEELDKDSLSKTLTHIVNSISKIFEGTLNILFENTKLMSIPKFRADSEEDFIYSRLEESMELIESSFKIENDLPDKLDEDLKKELNELKMSIKK